MKRLTGGLALLLALCLSGNVQANFVIDDFDAGTTDDTGSFNSAVGVGGGSALAVPSGVFINAGGAGQGADVIFDISAASPNPTGYGYFSTLVLDLAAVGDWNVEFIIDNDAGTMGGEGMSVAPTAVADTATGASVDLIASLGTGNLNGLEQLTLRFTSVAPGGLGNRTLFLQGVAAVPEPTSFALLGITCLGGGAVATRRRRRKELAA